MTINRYAAKIDATQQEVAKGLRSAGIEVWFIRRPCDLLTRFWCNRHHDFCWQPMEVKRKYGKKDPKVRVDPRQKSQNEFLNRTLTPVVTSFDEAWTALNARHSLTRIQPEVFP